MEDNILPDFSEFDFTETTAPYDYLFEFKDDDFILQQLIGKLRKQATALGVRNFLTLWNSYLKSRTSQEKGLSLIKSTNFSDAEIQLVSGDYICTDSGVKTFDRFGSEVNICLHPILPVKRYVNIDTNHEKLEIAYRKGFQWNKLIVEKNTIATNKIIELSNYGVVVHSENSKKLGTYLLEMEQLNFDKIPEVISVGRLGWTHDHGFAPYVEKLTFDGDSSFQHIFNSVKPNGDYQKWFDIVKDVRKTGSVASKICLASSFASPLLNKVSMKPFFVHFWGKTGTGKTVALSLAASVWGNPKVGEYIGTFNSTDVAMEMMAGFFNHLPLCLDELQLQKAQNVHDFDAVIYKLCEGSGKHRGAKEGGLRKQITWQNCIMTTGETTINHSSSGGGAINRVVEVECKEDEVIYRDLPKLIDVVSHNYGFAGAEFVKYLSDPLISERVKALQKQYLTELMESDTTEKQAAAGSIILAADHLVTELLFKDAQALTVTDIQEVLTSKQTVDINVRALEFLLGWVTRNNNKFTLNDFGAYAGEIWGIIEDNECFIIKSIFDSEMQKAGFDSKAFLSWAKNRGVTRTQSGENRKVVKKKIKGGSVWCVCLDLNYVEIAPDSDDLPFF